MAIEIYLATRRGCIQQISVQRYTYCQALVDDPVKKDEFDQAIVKKYRGLIMKITSSKFFSFKELPSRDATYSLEGSVSVSPPFTANSTQIFSSLIGELLRQELSKTYRRFLNQNTFIVEAIEHPPFKLLKCFEFDVEFFETGEYLIHLLPITKIVSQTDTVNEEYLARLKSTIRSNNPSNELKFCLTSTHKRKKVWFDLADSDLEYKTNRFLQEHPNTIATFDYHFIANFSPPLLRAITSEATKEIKTNVKFLNKVIDRIKLPKGFGLSEERFLKADAIYIGNQNNLIVGSQAKATKLAASYYNGIYQPVNNTSIQPIVVGEIDATIFYDIVYTLNKGGHNFAVLPPILLTKDERPSLEQGKAIHQKAPSSLIVVFTKTRLNSNFFEHVYRHKREFYTHQIDSSDQSRFKLTNFACRCLEKLGGTVAAIANSHLSEGGYFIGIDLGHTTSDARKSSNLAVTIFNHLGVFQKSTVIQGLERNESLTEASCLEAFWQLSLFLAQTRQTSPSHIVIHRDGRLHPEDIKCLTNCLTQVWSPSKLDIVEIIKTGYPLVVEKKSTNQVNNPPSGACYVDDKNKYAILITNTQSEQVGEAVRPIVIKHKYGVLPFAHIIDQVYWLTRVYTNNYHHPTRLPATTFRANNIASTSPTKHTPSFSA